MTEYKEEDFQTKFNLGDIVYWISDKIYSGEVISKKLFFRREGGTSNLKTVSLIEYQVRGCNHWEEDKFYFTQKEAAHEWLRRSGLEPGLIDG